MKSMNIRKRQKFDIVSVVKKEATVLLCGASLTGCYPEFKWLDTVYELKCVFKARWTHTLCTPDNAEAVSSY